MRPTIYDVKVIPDRTIHNPSHTFVGRPAEFDRDEAIANAIRMFARHGFEGASTSDFVASMGIGHQSLYDAFGDKRRLFLEALRQDASVSLDQMSSALAECASALGGIENAVLVGMGDCGDLESGCLGVCSVAEFGRSDLEINAVNDAAGVAVSAAFAARVREGIAVGELNPHLNLEAAARMLLTLRSGFKIAVRGGASLDQARATASLALCGLAAS